MCIKTTLKGEVLSLSGFRSWSTFTCCNLSDLTIPEIPDKFEESDESSSSAHPRTAVNQHGSFRHLDQIVLRLVLQVQHHLRVSRHLQVSPGLAVELLDSFHLTFIVEMERKTIQRDPANSTVEGEFNKP